MQNKWRKYGGITVISLLITYIIFMQFNYQRLLKRSEQESQARQEMEWLLKSRERQVQFYFDKVNELIAANQKLAMTNGSLTV
ncbi:hypothetical protein [Paenibacillus fonticola]|uniref:hypothetical protein n=1 Tax=Paenibacillus fonticola TaxID=379896 RepID=UPI000366B76D|nr:hypothetical protein [Paenibacillus fonticola]